MLFSNISPRIRWRYTSPYSVKGSLLSILFFEVFPLGLALTLRGSSTVVAPKSQYYSRYSRVILPVALFGFWRTSHTYPFAHTSWTVTQRVCLRIPMRLTGGATTSSIHHILRYCGRIGKPAARVTADIVRAQWQAGPQPYQYVSRDVDSNHLVCMYDIVLKQQKPASPWAFRPIWCHAFRI